MGYLVCHIPSYKGLMAQLFYDIPLKIPLKSLYLPSMDYERHKGDIKIRVTG